MGSFRRFHRYGRSKFSVSALSAAAVLGLFFTSAPVEAQNISRMDGGKIETSGNKVDIYAGKVQNSVGTSIFKNFDLDQNHIANMHFHTADTVGGEAESLINFVNSKININGTLNAIRNGKIGGNLYFLSQQGLVVGKTGVINAGTFNMQTVSDKYDTEFNTLDQLYLNSPNIIKQSDTYTDKHGTIEVYGQINTIDGVRLKAGRSVTIGNGTDMAALKTGVVDFSNLVNIDKGSTVQSGLTGEALKATRAGNGDIVLGELYKGDFANGDIELSAKANSRNAFDADSTWLDVDTDGDNVVKTDITVAKNAAVQGYGNVTATAKSTNGLGQSALISEDITSSTLMDLLGSMATTKAAITVDGKINAGYDVTTGKYTEAINIKGESYDPSVTLDASTTNSYAAGKPTAFLSFVTDTTISKLLESFEKSKNFSLSLAKMSADATITIGNDAEVHAQGNVSMNAYSNMYSSSGATAKSSVLSAKLRDAQEMGIVDKQMEYIPATSFAYSETDTNATIDIAGEVTSEAGDITATAKSESFSYAEASAAELENDDDDDDDPAGTTPKSSTFKFAFLYGDNDTNAKVNIQQNAKLTADEGSVELSSAVTSCSIWNVSTSTSKGAMLETSVLLGTVNGTSEVNINGEITAKDGISANSKNETEYYTDVSNSITMDNSTKEEDEPDPNLNGRVMEFNNEQERDEAANAIGDVLNQLADENVDAGDAVNNTWRDLFSVGMSLNISKGDIKANTNVGKTAKLNVTGKPTVDKDGKVTSTPSIDLKSESTWDDMNMLSFSSISKSKDKDDKSEKAIGAAVLVAKLNNNAQTTIESGTDKQHAELTAPAITLESEATAPWDRYSNMQSTLQDACNKLTEDVKVLVDRIPAAFEYDSAEKAYKENPTNENLVKMNEAAEKLYQAVCLDTTTRGYNLVKARIKKVISCAKDFLAFTSYANFAAGSAVSSSSEGSKISVSVAGTLNYNDVNNNAKVLVGRNAVLDATAGDIEMSSTTESCLASITGAANPYNYGEAIGQRFPSTVTLWNKLPKFMRKYIKDQYGDAELTFPYYVVNGSDTGIGGSVDISYRDANAIINVAEGANLKATGELTLTANNETISPSIAYAGAVNGTNGFVGMGVYQGGTSNAIATVDDEATVSVGDISLSAQNLEYIVNIAADMVAMKKNAVGAAVTISNRDNNTFAGILNNDKYNGDEDEDDGSAGYKVRKLLNSALTDNEKTYLGTADTDVASSVTAENINGKAETKGRTYNIAFSGTKTNGETEAEDRDGAEGLPNPQGFKEFFSKLNLSMAGSIAVNQGTATTITAIEGNKNATKLNVNGNGNGKVTLEAYDDAINAAISGAAALQFLEGNDQDASKYDATIAGAVAANTNSHYIYSLINNAKLSKYQLVKNEAHKDGVDATMGLAIGLQSVKADSKGVSLVGSVNAMNMKNDVKVDISGSEITDSGMVKNIAYNKDGELAGSISATLAKNNSFGIGAAVTYLTVDNDLTATINNTTITATSLENLAVSKMTQSSAAISGGWVSGDDSKLVAYGAWAENDLDNNVQASVTGSSITTEALHVRAYDGDLEELAVPSTPSGSTTTKPDDQKTDGEKTDGEKTDGDKTDTSKTETTKSATENEHLAEMREMGFDVDGQDTLDLLNKSDSGVSNLEVNQDKLTDDAKVTAADLEKEMNKTLGKDTSDTSTSTETKNSSMYYNGDKLANSTSGNRMVTTAVSFVKTDASNVSASAAVVKSNIKNNYNAVVDSSTVKTTENTSIDAKSNTFMLSLGGGFGVNWNGDQDSLSVEASGSGSGLTTDNSIKAKLQNSKVTAKELTVTAKSDDELINVVGAGGYDTSDTVGVGVNVAVNSKSNITGAYIYGSDVDASTVKVQADNDSNSWAFSVGAKLNKDVTVKANGSVAKNTGTDDVEAIVDSYDDGKGNTKDNTFTDAESISVKATDTSKQKAIAGGLDLANGGKVAIGGAVAYTEIGDYDSDKKNEKKQKLIARLNNSTINMKQGADSKNITVSASNKDSSSMAVAVGVALSNANNVNVQGSGAASYIALQTEASMTDTSIKDAEKTTSVNVDAESKNSVTTSADLLSGNMNMEGLSVSGAMGVGTANISEETKAFINGTDDSKKLSLELGDVTVQANSEQHILNVGAGIATAAGSGIKAGVAGNLTINNINNDILASMENISLDAGKTAKVDAQDKKTIQNYAGTIDIGAGSGAVAAAVGGTVGINKIGGTTDAHIADSTLKVAGADGLTIAANSENKIRNVLVTAGLAVGTGAATVGVNGTVAINKIEGSTSATLQDSDYNKAASDSEKIKEDALTKLVVKSSDKADIISGVGNGSIAVASTADFGVGVAADSNTLSRNSSAQIIGNSKDNSTNAQQSTINASSVDVQAASRQELASYAVGLAVGAGSTFGLGTNGSISSSTLSSTTIAAMQNIKGVINAVDVDAKHTADITRLNVGSALGGGYAGGAVGVSVAVLNDDNSTYANFLNNSLIGTADGKQTVAVDATNDSTIKSSVHSGAGVIALIGGAIGGNFVVDGFTNKVGVNVGGNSIGTDTIRAASFEAKAQNKVKEDMYQGNYNAASVFDAAPGVGVTTNDTSVYTNITGNKIYANAIDIEADEARNYETQIVNAGGALADLGVSVLTNNINAKADKVISFISTTTDSSSKSTDTITKVDVGAKLDTVDRYLAEQTSYITDKNVDGSLTKAGISEKDIVSNMTTKRGGDATAEGVQVVVNNSELYAQDAVTIKAHDNNNLTADNDQYRLAAGSINVVVSTADVNSKVGTSVTNSTISAIKKNSTNVPSQVEISSVSDGQLNNKASQGYVNLGTIFHASTETTIGGENKVLLDKAAINSQVIAVGAKDALNNRTETEGYNISLVPMGALYAKAQTKTNNSVEIKNGSQLLAGYTRTTDKDGTVTYNKLDGDSGITIRADKTNKVESVVNETRVAGLSGNGLIVTAIDGEESDAANSTSAQNTVTIAGSTFKTSGNILATATKQLGVAATLESYGGALAGVSVGKSFAYATGASRLESGEGNSYLADGNVSLQSVISKQDGADSSIKATQIANSLSGLGVGVGVNEAKVVYNEKAEVIASKAVYQADTLNINAIHNVDVSNTSKGIEVGILASGTMLADSYITADTVVTAGGVDYAMNDVTSGNDYYETDADGNIIIDETTQKPKLKHPEYYVVDADGYVVEDETTHQAKLKHPELVSSVKDVKVSGNANITENILAQGGGGGVIDVSPLSSKALNILKTNTVTNVYGDWRPTNTFTAEALNKDSIKQESTSFNVIGVGYGGTKNYNVVQHNAQLNVGDASHAADIQTSGKQLFQAGNDVNHDVRMSADGGGVLVGSAATMGTKYEDQASKYASKVNFTQAKLTSNSNGQASDSSINAQSFTTGTLRYDNELMSGGLIDVVHNDSIHDITYDNGVSVGAGSAITTKDKNQDIKLASYDNTKAEFNTFSRGAGLATVVYGTTDVNFTRNSSINVDKDASLDSAHDTYLNASADLNNASSQLDYKALATAYAKSVIPAWTSPEVNNHMTQNNVVTVSGLSKSVHNANITATTGKNTIKTDAVKYKWYTGESSEGQFIATDDGEANAQQTANNRVDITSTGHVLAGTHSNLNLVINGNLTEKDGNYDSSGVTVDFTGEDKTKSGSEWFDLNTVSKDGIISINNPLYNHYVELAESMSGYDQGSEQYKSLKTELEALQGDMVKSGFGYYATDESGTQTFVVIKNRAMAGIELPDINVSGGNININTDKLEGAGTLEAKGANDITITNNSNMHLLVNDVIIQEPGGMVNINGVSVDKDTIHTKESIKKVTEGYTGTLVSNPTIGANSTINITNTGITSKDLQKYTNTDMTVQGTVQNISGDVTLRNENSNINIDNAKILGQNTKVIADKGSISQTSDGYTTIGRDPIAWYQFSQTIAEKIQRYVTKLVADNKADQFHADSYDDYCNYLLKNANDIGLTAAETSTIKEKQAEYAAIASGAKDGGNGIFGGDNVYISARSINIDGLIQSGYNKYSVEYTDSMKININKLDSDYAASGTVLTDKDVLGNKAYLINGDDEYGAIYDSTNKCYRYGIRLYYNPSTKSILSEDVNTGGGKIYLNGAITSTGNGRILAMDGAANVIIDLSKVTEENERKLVLSDIKVNNVDGLISIRDTSKKLLTEYAKHDGVFSNRTASYVDGKIGDFSDWAESDGTYQPLNGSTLNWTGGTSGDTTTTHYVGKVKTYVWGLITIDDGNRVDSIKNHGGSVSTTTDSSQGGGQLANGVYYDTNAKTYGFSVIGQQNTDKSWDTDVVTSKDTPWYYAGFYTEYTFKWDNVKTSSTSSTYSLKADKPISVGLLDSADGVIYVRNFGDMLLKGTVANASVKDADGNTNGVGSVSMGSISGSIVGYNSSVDVMTDRLSAYAYKDVSLTQSTLGKTADIFLHSANGNINLESTSGDLVLRGGIDGRTGALNGTFAVAAAGNITTPRNDDGSYSAEKIVGKRVILDSQGSVDVRVAPGTEIYNNGTASDGLSIEAAGDIKVYHAEGENTNLNIGVIESTDGNVTLETQGSFVDVVDDNSLSDAKDKLEYWREMGLISDSDADSESTDSAAKAKAQVMKNVKAQLAYLSSKDDGTGVDEAQLNKYIDAANAFNSIAKTYQDEMKAAGTDTTKQAEAKAKYEAATSVFFAQDAYAGMSESAQKAIVKYAEADVYDGYGWSANELLYAIQYSVLNSKPGQIVLGDTANVKGNNITLKAGRGVGMDAADINIAKDKLSELENMRILSQAKAGDLTWNEDGSVTVRMQKPILVDFNDPQEGKINVQATDNVYLASINGSALNIDGSITTTKDIKLMAAKGLTTSDSAVLSGHNLTLYGGEGSIGSLEHAVKLDKITGVLDANTAITDPDDKEKNLGIYIEKSENGALTLQNVVTGDLYINTNADLQWTTETGKTGSYINAKSITIESKDANGVSIGTEDSALRVLNNGAVVTIGAMSKGEASANDKIYLHGVNDNAAEIADKDKLLRINALIAEGAANVTSDGGLELVEDATANHGQYFTGSNGLVYSKDISLQAQNDIALQNGVISQTINLKDGPKTLEGAKAKLESKTGSITQSTEHYIDIDDLAAFAEKDVTLTSGAGSSAGSTAYNKLAKVTLGSTSGNISLANGGDKALEVTIEDYGNGVANSIDIHNYKAGVANTMSVGGNIRAAGDINLQQDEVQDDANNLLVKGNVHSESGNINITSAKNITITPDSLNITADEGNIFIWAIDGDIVNDADLSAENGSAKVWASNGNISGKGGHIKAGDVVYMAKDDIDFNSENGTQIIAGATEGDDPWGVGGSISLISAGGNVNIWKDAKIDAKGNVLLDAQKNIVVGKSDAETTGDLGTVNSKTGNVTLRAQTGYIDNLTSIAAAEGKVSLISKQDTIINAGDITGKSVLLDAYKDLNLGRTADGTVINGTITATGTDSSDSLQMLSRNGSITLYDDATLLASNDIILWAYKNVTNNMQPDDEQHQGGLYTANGSILMTAVTGDVTNNNAVFTDKGDISLLSLGGNVYNNGELQSGKNVTLNAAKAVENQADIAAAGDIAITAQNGTLGNTATLIANRSIKLTASKDSIANSGSLEAANDITLRAKENIQSGTEEAGADVTSASGKVLMVAENGSLTSFGNVTAQNDIDLQAKLNLLSNGGLSSAASNVLLTAGSDLTNIGNLDAAANVVASAGGDLISTGDAKAASNVYMDAGSNLSTTGNITAGADAGLSAGADLTNNGNINAMHDVTLEAGNAIYSEGNVLANNDVSFAAKGSTSEAATGIAVITNRGNVTAMNGALSFNASGNNAGYGIDSEGRLTANKDVTLWAQGSVSSTGYIGSEAGKVLLYSKSGSASTKGSITAAQNVTIQASKAVVTANTDEENADSIKSLGGSVLLNSAAGDVSNSNNITAAKDVTLLAYDSAYNNGVINAKDGSATITAATGELKNTNAITASKNIALWAKGELENGTLTSADDQLTAGNNITLTSSEGAITNYADMDAQVGYIKMAAAGNIGTVGNLTAAKEITVTSTAGNIEAGGAFNAKTDGITMSADGNVTTLSGTSLKADAGRITLRAGSNIDNAATGEAYKTIILNAGDSIINRDKLQSETGDVMLYAGQNIDNSADITAAESVIMSTNKGNINNGSVDSSDGKLTAGNGISIQAGGKATNYSELAAGTPGSVTDGTVLVAGNDVYNEGEISGITNVTLYANHSLKNKGEILVTRGNAKLRAGNDLATELGSIENNAKIDAYTRIDFTADGSVDNAGKLISGNDDIALNSAFADVTNTGEVHSAADIEITAGKNIKNGAVLNAEKGAISLTAGGGIVSNGGNMIALDNISLVARSSDGTTENFIRNNDGLFSIAGNVSLDSGGTITNYGIITADGSITMNAVKSLYNGGVEGEPQMGDGMLTSDNGSVTLTSTKSTVTNSGNISAANNVEISAYDVLQNEGDIKAGTGYVDLTSENAGITNTGDISAKGTDVSEATVTLDAKTTITNGDVKGNGKIDATGNISLLAGGDIRNNSAGRMNSAYGDILISTSGNVTNNANLTANNGAISIYGNDILQGIATITAGNDVSMVGSGNVTNRATIASTGGDVFLDGMNVTNEGVVTAYDDINFIADNDITNTAKLDADGDINMQADGNINNSGNLEAMNVEQYAGGSIVEAAQINATNDVDITAETGSIASDAGIYSALGDINMQAGGAISQNGTVKADIGSIFVNAGDTLTTNGQIKGFGGVTLTGKNNVTTTNGNIVSEAGDVLIRSDEGAVDFGGDITGVSVTVQAAKDLHVSGEERTITATGTANNDVLKLVSTGGKVTLDSNIKLNAANDLVVEAQKGIWNSTGNVLTAGNDITLITQEDTLSNDGIILAAQGDVWMESVNGSVKNAGDVTGKSVTAKSHDDLYIDGGSITSTADELNLISTAAKVLIKKQDSLNATGDLNVQATTGIINSADGKQLSSAKGDVNLITEGGLIDNLGNIVAENGNVLLQSQDNLYDADGNVVTPGTIINNGNIKGQNVTLDAYNKLTIDNDAAHSYEATGTNPGDKLQFISRTDSIEIMNDANIKAAGDIDMYAKKDIYNYYDGQRGTDLNAGGDIALMADTGKIVNNSNMNAKGNISVYADESITNIGKVIAGSDEIEDASATGNIYYQTNGKLSLSGGVIEGKNNVEMYSINDQVSLKENATSQNGNIVIKAYKDVDAVADAIEQGMVEIIAKKGNATITSQNGNINTDKVDAYNVYYKAESYEHTNDAGETVKSEIHGKQTYVSNILGITGNNVYLHDTANKDSGLLDPDSCFDNHGIWQTGDGTLLQLQLDTVGTADGKHIPADQLILNFHRINGKLDIDKLWVKRMELHVPDSAELAIHKLAVEDRVDISTDTVHTIVYGKDPKPEHADTIYWQDYAHHNPGMSDEAWDSWNNPADNSWMYLFFNKNGTRQDSNGVLLHKNDYRYVYSQRYAADDWLLHRTLFEEAALRGDISLIPLYERYNLYDAEDEETEAVKIELKD